MNVSHTTKTSLELNTATPSTKLTLQAQVSRIQSIKNRIRPLECCGTIAIVFNTSLGCPFCGAEDCISE